MSNLNIIMSPLLTLLMIEFDHVLSSSQLANIGTCACFKTTIQCSRKYFYKSYIKVMWSKIKLQSFSDN